MHSAIYSGWVRHKRRTPVSHVFQYPLALFYIDLDEWSELTARFGLGKKGWLPLSLCRKDYMHPSELPLKQAVLDQVEAALKLRPNGPVRLLTQPRFFGFCFNPVSFYYCFDHCENLQAIVADITNTPWNERYSYILPVTDSRQQHLYSFKKDFHVSPFMPMNQQYEWRFDSPGNKLLVHMENRQDQNKVFSATLSLKHHPLTKKTIRSTFMRFPLQTYRVVWGIYWHALRLKLKRVPFYSHPKHSTLKATREELL